MPLASGASIGPYEILSLLGTGGMGEVYRAVDCRLGREVAIKVLPAAFAVEPDRLRRFDQEARAAAALNHPNILAIYDVGTSDGAPYIVSELLQGQTLRAVLAQRALVPRATVEYATAIASGLAAAHEAGIDRGDIHALTRDGRERIVHRGMGSVRILDLSADGRALLTQDSFRADMSLVDVNTSTERELSWRNWSRPMAMSDDGSMLAFGLGGRTDREGKGFGYVRRTDGSPAVLVTDTGNPMAFSPDGRWLVAGSPSSNDWTVVPTGIGQTRRVRRGEVVKGNGMTNGFKWRDGSRIAFVGSEEGHRRRLYVQNLDAAQLTRHAGWRSRSIRRVARLVDDRRPE